MGALSSCQEISNGDAFIVDPPIGQVERKFVGGMDSEERDLELIAGWLTLSPLGLNFAHDTIWV